MMKRFVLIALVLLGLPSAVAAQCFTMDMSAGAQSLAGWPDVRNDEAGIPVFYGTIWDMTYDATGGPDGIPIYRQRHIGGSAGSGFYSGWQTTTAGDALCSENIPTQGVSRFGRLIFRYVPTNNFRCGGPGTNCNFKVIIHADSCANDSNGGNNACRAILELRGQSSVGLYAMRLAIGGGDIPATTGTVYEPGTWYWIQYEMDSSTTTSSADGCFKIWINNQDYGNPTATNGCNDVVRTGSNQTGWGTVKFAGFHNEAAWATGDVDHYEIAGFEYDTVFDAAFGAQEGGADITDPVVTITGPTSSATYATSSTPLTVSGTCTDNINCASVSCSNSAGGSGTATGTGSWSQNLVLTAGENVITCTGVDAAANDHADIITVTYTPPPPEQPGNGLPGGVLPRRFADRICPAPPVAGCLDRGVPYPLGEGPPIERLSDGLAIQRDTIARRIRGLEAAGFWVHVSTKSTYTQILATCSCV